MNCRLSFSFCFSTRKSEFMAVLETETESKTKSKTHSIYSFNGKKNIIGETGLTQHNSQHICRKCNQYKRTKHTTRTYQYVPTTALLVPMLRLIISYWQRVCCCCLARWKPAASGQSVEIEHVFLFVLFLLFFFLRIFAAAFVVCDIVRHCRFYLNYCRIAI